MSFQIEDENRQLRLQVDHMKKELMDKSKQLEALKNRPSALDKDQILVYQSQIKVITEDFLQEREDRTREHQKSQALEEELLQVKNQVCGSHGLQSCEETCFKCMVFFL